MKRPFTKLTEVNQLINDFKYYLRRYIVNEKLL